MGATEERNNREQHNMILRDMITNTDIAEIKLGPDFLSETHKFLLEKIPNLEQEYKYIQFFYTGEDYHTRLLLRHKRYICGLKCEAVVYRVTIYALKPEHVSETEPGILSRLSRIFRKNSSSDTNEPSEENTPLVYREASAPQFQIPVYHDMPPYHPEINVPVYTQPLPDQNIQYHSLNNQQQNNQQQNNYPSEYYSQQY